jgi:uncharacterized protein (TIGR03435 family)
MRAALAIAGVAVVLIPIAVYLAQSPLLRAQSSQAAQKPSFEVASIKRNVAIDAERGGGFEPGGRFLMTNVDVRTLVRMAFRSGPVLFPSQIIGGPDWTGNERYDVAAKVGSELAEKTPAELGQVQPLLLQSLLEDRVKLKVHRETRNLQRYALVVARKDGALGPQLRRSSANCGADFSRCATVARPGMYTSGGTPIGSLSNYLAGSVLQQVVVDHTGLEGRFEIHLEWLPDQMTQQAAADPAVASIDKPSIFTALQEQLGLRLESERGPVDVIVIDHVERPTEN